MGTLVENGVFEATAVNSLHLPHRLQPSPGQTPQRKHEAGVVTVKFLLIDCSQGDTGDVTGCGQEGRFNTQGGSGDVSKASCCVRGNASGVGRGSEKATRTRSDGLGVTQCVWILRHSPDFFWTFAL